MSESTIGTLTPPVKNNKREIFGWLIYDWANSAFFTTVISVLIAPYLIDLATRSVGEDGIILNLGFFNVTPKGLPSFCLALSIVSQVFFLPILGAIADYTHLKKRLMAFFCYFGVLCSALLFFITESYIGVSILLVLSNMSFAAANVFYNAFLVDITTEDKRDKISSYGFASGYIGGVIMLVMNIAMIQLHESLGMSKGFAVRLSMLLASLWWGIFAFCTFYLLKQRAPDKQLPKSKNLVTVGFTELKTTFRQLFKLKYTTLFLIGYLFYNDGIQTVILMSSPFMTQELFLAKGLEPDQSFLLIIFLIAQISALVGSLGFERVARVVGAKNTILISLAIWCVIVIYAYGFLETKTQAMIMGTFIGLVLGSTQALSRSLFSQMIPVGRESSFFGLYEISEKGTSWLGQLVFTIVISATGSFRQSILALIFFFVVGSIILFFTDTTRAIHEAGQHTPEEAAAIEAEAHSAA